MATKVRKKPAKKTVKKTPAKKRAGRAVAVKKVVAGVPEKRLVGKITHFYDRISVAVVDVLDTLAIGDKIQIEGHGRSFQQTVDSMQIEHKPVKTAKKGQSIGLKVVQSVKEGDLVFKV